MGFVEGYSPLFIVRLMVLRTYIFLFSLEIVWVE